ncbi:transmembrane protease serine 5 isoform X2 [Microcaecilia unicolor]|uniref:Transmembrane protease serine 5 isoform X2 n=1 Tax=Microcaecilia unicolor TaxID=1415580 RepID=A0A6P7ZG11_9AMPH|nr:transmembrane protease serine 5 isoform X2 [Microcaecilia unicolor]
MSSNPVVQFGADAQYHAEGKPNFENDQRASVAKQDLRNGKTSSEPMKFFVKSLAHQDPNTLQDTEMTMSYNGAGSDVTTSTPRKVSFRINAENLLEVQVEGRPGWLLACHDGWKPSLGTVICRQLGHIRFLYHKGVNKTDIMLNYNQEFAQVVSTQNNSTDHMWQPRTTCSSGRIVALKCSECGTYAKTSQTEGSDSTLGQWPWQVRLYFNSRLVCSGSVVTEQWIITAAHCVHKSLQVSGWLAVAGMVTHLCTEQCSSFALEKIIYHQNYNEKSHDYDIALMKLKSPLRFSESIQSVCLPQYNQDLPVGMQCWITRWGYTKDNTHNPQLLKEVAIPLISSKICNDFYQGVITPRMLCAGYLDRNGDAGQGDSGGPLVCQTEHTWHLIGLVSWDNGKPNHPGVYTKMPAFVDWIYHVIDKN